MIDESIRIKLSQFMLAYQRQCAELQFQKQNIKQNVMLSIIENKNTLKNNPSNLNNLLEKSMAKSKVYQNLASSKQTKFSEQKSTPQNRYTNNQGHDQQYQELQRSKLSKKNNSRLLQRSDISIKDNKSNMLKNNFLNEQIDDKHEVFQQPMEKSSKSGLHSSSYLKSRNKALEIEQVQENEHQDMTKSQKKSYIKNTSKVKMINQMQNQRKISESRLNDPQNMGGSSVSRKNQSRINQKRQQQLQQAYSRQKDNLSQTFSKKSLIGSKVFPNSQKAIKQKNPSIIKHQEYEGELQNYPTFKKPSFQFITNLSQLRQSNPHQQQYQPQEQEQEQQEQQQEREQKEQREQQQEREQQEQQEHQYYPQQKSYDEQQQEVTHKKWNSNRQNYQYNQPQQDQNQDFNQYEKDQSFANNNQSNTISNIQEDQSMILPSQFRQKPKQPEPNRKSYMAFEINMEKSNLPNNQNLQQLKKKKILELQRKRLERIQNNSKRKLNPSQINTPNQKTQKIQQKYQQKQTQKQYSNIFIGSNRQNSKKQLDHRDSLNKSVNDRRQERTKNLKNSGYRQQQTGNKDSIFQDNRTIMTKYGQQSKISNNIRSTSPLNTVKTVHTTDKRPPLNRNKRQQNIFAGDSGFQRNQGESGYQRQRSIHKVSDPKIVPIDRKNSFQKKSNIKLIVNAITYTCLPGELNRRERQKLIDILDDYQSEFFIFLFKEYSRKVIKGIYILENGQDRIVKIYGQKAPMEIFAEQVHEFYRFDSGSREFKKIDGCKSFSFSVHAVDLK